MIKFTLLLNLLLVLFLITSCTTVKPWQKEKLAAQHMYFDTEPLRSTLIQHIRESKSGSAGAYTVGGGGCGCK